MSTLCSCFHRNKGLKMTAVGRTGVIIKLVVSGVFNIIIFPLVYINTNYSGEAEPYYY
jgi:hypothetical protein